MSVLAQRLKEARLRAGLSQEKLGIEAGLDEMSSSARMNRYETGARVPGPELVERFAKVLGVSAPYFYARDDDLAELLLLVGPMRAKDLARVIEFARELKR